MPVYWSVAHSVGLSGLILPMGVVPMRNVDGGWYAHSRAIAPILEVHAWFFEDSFSNRLFEKCNGRLRECTLSYWRSRGDCAARGEYVFRETSILVDAFRRS